LARGFGNGAICMRPRLNQVGVDSSPFIEDLGPDAITFCVGVEDWPKPLLEAIDFGT
jgi:hypothetical protein